MTASRKLTSVVLALFALVVMSASATAADPGLAYPPQSEVSDQKAGSVLFYNYYTSGTTAATNTRMNITNTSTTSSANVHLFFVDSVTCNVADQFICLTPNQTTSFQASEIDPLTTGYVVAVASNDDGCPVVFNHLIGDEYFKTATHSANLGAEAFAALGPAGTLPGCDANSVTAVLNFNGRIGGYNRAPRVLALSNFASRADGNDTLVIVNRVGGNLATGPLAIGSIFGLAYDDIENPGSFNFSSSRCQFQFNITGSFPRTAPPLSTLVPAGRSGWMKFYSQSDVALLGAAVNAVTATGDAAGSGFAGGHNLHKLTLSATASLTIPVFPPNC